MIDLTHEWQNVLVDQFLENPKFMNSSLSLANAFATKKIDYGYVLVIFCNGKHLLKTKEVTYNSFKQWTIPLLDKRLYSFAQLERAF